MTRSLEQALLQGADVSAMASANLLVNGFHVLNQEKAGAAVTASGAFPVDQWQVSSSFGAISAQQIGANPFPSQQGLQAGTRVTVTTAGTPTGADQMQVYQTIEGASLARLNYGQASARPMTLAFMLRPNYSGVAYFSLLNYGMGSPYRSFVKRLALVANQDNFFCFTIPGDVVQLLDLSNNASLQARWTFACGTIYATSTPDSWLAGNFQAGTDCTNMLATVGNTVLIGGCVLVPGRFTLTQDMLPLLMLRYEEEQRRCFRYFQTLKVTFQTFSFSQFPLVGLMRTTPSATLYSGGTNNGTISINTGATNHHVRQEASSSASIDASYFMNARM